MSLCPCGSRRDYDECCGPLLAGAPADSAEALMRSRYTAFTEGKVDYLKDTLTPEEQADFDPEETRIMATEAKWQGLEIRSASGGIGDDRGSVEFVARFKLRGQVHVHHERANFRRVDGAWRCADAVVNPKAPPRTTAKVGRNDPVPLRIGQEIQEVLRRLTPVPSRTRHAVRRTA